MSVMPLGHRTYLAVKAKGNSSMFEKVWCEEIAESHACQDPDGMAKPELAEPKCPLCKAHNLGLAIIPKVFRKPIEHYDEVNTLPDNRDRDKRSEGHEMGACSRPVRQSRTEHGIAYGSRGLW